MYFLWNLVQRFIFLCCCSQASCIATGPDAMTKPATVTCCIGLLGSVSRWFLKNIFATITEPFLFLSLCNINPALWVCKCCSWPQNVLKGILGSIDILHHTDMFCTRCMLQNCTFLIGNCQVWGHGGAPERPLCTTTPRSRCKGQWSPTCCWCTGRGWWWWSSCALVFSLGTCGVGRDDQTAMQQYTPKHWPVLTSPCFSVTCGYHICFTKRPPSTQWVSQVNDLCWDHWLLGVLQGRRLVEHN